MYTGILHTHVLMVMLFLLIHLIKIILLFGNTDNLEKFNQKTKVMHIIVSSLFLITGIYLAFNSGTIVDGMWFYFKLLIIVVGIPLAIIGVKKKNKILAIISFFLFVYAYGVSETKSITFQKKQNQITEDFTFESKDAQGKVIYEKLCQNCHGSDGTLGLSGAANLKASKLTNEEIQGIIKNGKKTMMSYKNILKDQEIAAVSSYVNSLKAIQ